MELEKTQRRNTAIFLGLFAIVIIVQGCWRSNYKSQMRESQEEQRRQRGEEIARLSEATGKTFR